MLLDAGKATLTELTTTLSANEVDLAIDALNIMAQYREDNKPKS